MSKPALTTLPKTATVEEVVAIIERDGGVIIDEFLDSETLAQLRTEIDAALDAAAFGEEDDFAGKRTRRAGALFASCPTMEKVALQPLYLGAARQILQKPIDVWFGQTRTTIIPDIQIGVTQAIEIHPGQGGQVLHRDDVSFLWRHPQYGREGRLQVMVAIREFTEENGGTVVIPQSHLWDDERMPLNEEAVNTVMPAGAALLWIGSTYHGGGQNKTESDIRTGVTMGYDLANLRQEENQYLSVPLPQLTQYSEEIQRLLGWSAGENFMGYIVKDGKMTDPHTLLEAQTVPDTVGLAAVR